MKKLITICAVAVMVLAVSAEASLITITYESQGSGTLAGNPFPVSDFVITAVGDTDDWSYDDGAWSIDHLSASISIDGVGDFEFLTGTRTFVTDNVVGFSRASGGSNLFDVVAGGQFAAWNRLDPIGPISGSGSLVQWTYTPLINTTGGILEFDNGTYNATFTAVPEPATMCLLGLGALSLVRRKK
ncbi:MAG: PEP-CTERM sorting domain-containing protein [Phycisphaerae bacterium]